jgi:3-oxoadipate enol-lactonase
MQIMRQESIPTSLGHLHVQLAGEGPAIVCWPSLLMTGSLWSGQVERFSREHLVVTIDPPGHGASDALERGFTLEECALCLTHILDALGLRDCVLLGNSWGGMVGGVFAALYPEHTRGAVLMNCTGSAASLRQKLEYESLVALARGVRKIPGPMVGSAVKAFAGRTTERTKPAVVEAIRSAVAAVDSRSVSWAIESVVPDRRDQHALLKTIRRPVLVIAGEEDRTFPVAETRAMADAIPGSTFRVLPQVGHLAALEAPELVNEVVAEFLRTLPPTASA